MLAELHNRALSKLLVKLENQLLGFKYSYYDFNSNLKQRMNLPAKYGTYYIHVIAILISLLLLMFALLNGDNAGVTKVSRKGKQHAVGRAGFKEYSAVEEEE